MKQRKGELNNKNLQDQLPEHFESIEAAAEFWDTHDSGDFEKFMKDVECEVVLDKFLDCGKGVVKSLCVARRVE